MSASPYRFFHRCASTARLAVALTLTASLSACQTLPMTSDARIAPLTEADKTLLDWRWPYQMNQLEWKSIRRARRAVELGDHQQGLARLNELAARGKPPAYYELAKMYHYGRGVSQDARRAETLYRQAIRPNSSIRDNAAYNLARLYLTRPELGEHSILAYHLLYEALAGERRAEALTWLGYLRAHGAEGIPANPGRAKRLYQQAIRLGSPEALRALAEAHRPGGFLPPDDQAADAYLTRYQETLGKLIAEGDVDAMLDMARLHSPSGLLPDSVKRRGWLERAVAAGSTDAMRQAGEMLLDQDTKDGLALLNRAAHRGSVPAMAKLGQLYLGEDKVPVSGDQARYWLEKAVDQGSTNAMVDLGGAWLHGNVLEHRPEAGQQLLEEAAKDGKFRAWTLLGRAYLDGIGVPRQPHRGLDYLQRAEAQGELSARVALGVLWLNGVLSGSAVQTTAKQDDDTQPRHAPLGYIISPQPQRGEALLQQAARQGERNAMRHLGEAYLAGERLPYQSQRAERLLQKAVALNDSTAMASLAEAWLQGQLSTQGSTQRALTLLERAAEQGNAYAMVLLGRAYRLAPAQVARDLQASENWLRCAVHAGHPSAQRALYNTLYAQGLEGDISALEEAATAGHPGAMEALGRRYLSGDGVAANATQARHWLEQAAAAGRDSAAWQLGRAYLSGEGLPRDMAAGQRYLIPLAEQGDITAARTLGRAYLEGATQFRNPALAERYLQQAIERGDLYALWSLGQALIREDSGLTTDIARGQALLEAGAEQGHVGSMAALGREYLSGERLNYQPERGARYLLEAAQAGNPDARTELVKSYLRANGLSYRRANQEQARQWLDQVIQGSDAIALRTLYQLLIETPPKAQEKSEQIVY
ncbi:MAG TPA: SEL1-like repeat protein [Halomonas sp.]|nr:SEL1-like repeat protein [Halomonas sp.]